MATNIYAKGALFVEGIYVADCINITLNYDPQNNVVVTQGEGFAGITPGAGQTTATIESAIPRAGYEVDWWKFALERTPAELICFAGSKERSVKGFLGPIDEKFGVNQNSGATINFTGGEPDVD